MSDQPEVPADTQAAGTLHDGAAILTDGRHIRVAEMACKDGTPYPSAFADRWPDVRDLFDVLRDAAGCPIEVVSGYRSPAYNARLAADSAAHQVASGSQHVEGRAMDLRPACMSIPDFHALCLRLWRAGLALKMGGLGRYDRSGWVHVDVRSPAWPGHLAQWTGT